MQKNKELIKFGKPFSPDSLGRGIEWRLQIAREQQRLAEALNGSRVTVTRCPICEDSASTPFAEVYGYSYRECTACGHIFLATPVDDTSVRAMYDGRSSNRSSQAKIYLASGVFEARLASIARPKVEFVYEALKAHGAPTAGLWVDIGCGAGELISAATEKGWAVRGVESDLAEVDFAISKGFDVRNIYFDQSTARMALEDANVVSLVNVLEHVRDPISVLKLAVKNSDAAVFVIEVPRHPSLSSLSAILFPEVASRHIYPPDHLHIFSERSVNLVLSECNLTRLGTWFFGQDALDFIQCAAASKRMAEGAFWRKVTEAIPALQGELDKSGLSDTMLIVAGRNV